MLLIGSRAIKYWFDDFHREPKDWDWITDDLSKPKPENIDGHHEYHLNPVLLPLSYHNNVLSSNSLYTLKISHLFWDIRWAKHMFDVQFLRRKGCLFNRDLFDKLYAYWNTIHGTNHRSDLTLDADAFFNNALKTYDHDYLHTLINPVPAYIKVLKDGSEVEPDEIKFQLLSHQEKLDLVREECYVMAYERLGIRDYREAYSWMIKKFIMNHAPMWEALWIIDNYIELHKPLINYKLKLDYELSRDH